MSLIEIRSKLVLGRVILSRLVRYPAAIKANEIPFRIREDFVPGPSEL